jgi:hypothetical protein
MPHKINFDFAQIPAGSKLKLSEIGMLSSNIEDIDASVIEWLKNDLELSATTNEGWKPVPIFWQTPERAFQVKNNRNLRDDSGSIILPVISVERTAITKDPSRKGGFQAHIYSNKLNGRTGRFVIAKQIVQNKTRDFAANDNVKRNNFTDGDNQAFYPRKNKKIVVKTLSIPIPVYINVDYKITLKTEYQQQMNELMAPFLTRTGQINSFVLRRNGHLYEVFIEQGFNNNNNVANLSEELRMFSTEITFKVLGYLIGEGENDDRPIVSVEENIVEIAYPRESIVTAGVDGFTVISS